MIRFVVETSSVPAISWHNGGYHGSSTNYGYSALMAVRGNYQPKQIRNVKGKCRVIARTAVGNMGSTPRSRFFRETKALDRLCDQLNQLIADRSAKK